jgi:hypothetical protein
VIPWPISTPEGCGGNEGEGIPERAEESILHNLSGVPDGIIGRHSLLGGVREETSNAFANRLEIK